jgi:phage terminase small subunit
MTAKTIEKEAVFLSFYLTDPERNASRAMLAAGYSPNGVGVRATEMLKRPSVKAAIERHTRSLEIKNDITLQEVVGELAKIARMNILDYGTPRKGGWFEVDFEKMTRDQAAAISEIKTEEVTDSEGNTTHKTLVKFWDKRSALVDLGKHLGGFKTKTELTGPDGGPLQMDNRIIVKVVKSNQER